MRKILGFSVVEVLAVVAMVGILYAFCLPLYTQHIVQAKRLEAETTLSKIAVALEKHYTTHHTYKNASLNSLGFSDTVAENHYQILLASADDKDFKLTATPLGKQAQKDTQCATLTLNALGEANITGQGKVADCW